MEAFFYRREEPFFSFEELVKYLDEKGIYKYGTHPENYKFSITPATKKKGYHLIWQDFKEYITAILQEVEITDSQLNKEVNMWKQFIDLKSINEAALDLYYKSDATVFVTMKNLEAYLETMFDQE